MVVVIAVTMSLYHMWVAGFGPPEAVIFRGTHLLFALTLVFLLFPLRPGGGVLARAFDAALLLLGWGAVLHIFVNYQVFTNRIIYIDDLTPWDIFYGIVAVLVVLEGTRRVIGWALPLTAIVFLIYATLFTQVKFPVLLEQLYYSTEGIFGSTLGVSASYVMLFVLFGAFMERSGTGQLFMDFAMALTGHQAGGPGKVAVVSSSLFGTVSGSAVANVMVDGPITIPLMKRTGFKPPFAAAVEAVASTGGQIDAPGHGRRGLRDGRVPGRVVRHGGDVGGDSGAAVLRGGVLRGALRGQARGPGRRAARGAAAHGPRDGRAWAPVHSHPDHPDWPVHGLLGAAVGAGRGPVLPAGGAVAREHAPGHQLAQRARARWRKARATRWRWRWPAPAPAS